MDGFFSKQETESLMRKDGKTYSCISCGLYKSCTSPKIKPYGKGKKKILIIKESPTAKEDQKGRHIPDAYSHKLFQSHGISIKDDCITTYAFKCRPPDEVDRNKSNFNLDCCRLYLMQVIKKYKPKLIIVNGKNSLYSLLGARWKGGLDTLGKWRGFVIPDQELKAWIVPVEHSHLAVLEENRKVIFERDIQAGIYTLEKVEFPIYKRPKIHVLRNSLRRLNTIKSGVIAFDYETTGLKPHGKGHRIVCASVAISPDVVYVFMMPKEKEKRLPFIKLLKNSKVKKMAHNMKFEENWSVVRLKTKVKNWYWDSMLAAHLIDNRSGITGLKFQTYVQFGIMDYSSDVTPHLKAKDSKNANSMNKLLKFVGTQSGEDKVLEYCALDSVFEYRLAMLQQDFINNKILPF